VGGGGDEGGVNSSILLNKIKSKPKSDLRNPKNGSSDNWTREGFIHNLKECQSSFKNQRTRWVL
jgi:hypothetical protein